MTSGHIAVLTAVIEIITISGSVFFMLDGLIAIHPGATDWALEDSR